MKTRPVKRRLSVPFTLAVLCLLISSAASAGPDKGRETKPVHRPVFWRINGDLGVGSYQSIMANVGLTVEYRNIFILIRWQGGSSYRYGLMKGTGGRVREFGALAGYTLRKKRSSYSLAMGISSVFSDLHPEIWTFQEITPFRGAGIPFEFRYSYSLSPRMALSLRVFATQITEYSYGGVTAGIGFGKLR